MKSDIDIKDDIYLHLRDSALRREVSGTLDKTKRPDASALEDIVISVLANEHLDSQMQEAVVQVNVYVPDLLRGTQYVEHSARLRELCRVAALSLGSGRGEGYRFTLTSQKVMEVNGRNEHFINNRLLYKFSKE